MRQLVRLASGTAMLLSLQTWANCRLLRRPPAAATVTDRVSLLLPVRDEAHRLAPCVRSLMAQTHLPEVELLVLDDCSSDGTAQLVQSLTGVPAIAGAQLPPGWLGKPHACQQLADAASGSVLVFVDADVVLAPDAVARAVGLLRQQRLQFLSPYPRQQAVTVAERLVQPLLQWSWLSLLPLRLSERSPRPSLCAANGQFLVVDTNAYRSSGGHTAVRDQVVEDVALARALRRVGARGGFVDGTELAACRMYAGGPDLLAGYTKSLWAAFGSPAGAAGVCAFLLLVYVAPPLAALRGSRAGLVGYAAGVGGRMLAARRTGGHVMPDSLAQPVSVLALVALTARSVRHHAAGRLQWKGRRVA